MLKFIKDWISLGQLHPILRKLLRRLPTLCLLVLTATSYSQEGRRLLTPIVKNPTPIIQIQTTQRQNQINKYYHLALAFKNGDSLPQDYQKAFEYFSKAAELGDPQSIYAVGYCLFKGLGCTVSYEKAAKYFKEGAYSGRDNSMYMLALCYRNNYVNITHSEDSAKYWLKKAAALGYRQATMELNTKTPEHKESKDASELIAKIHNAAIPSKVPLNQFIAIKESKPDSSIIYGHYYGFLIGYDWSGDYIIQTKKLQLILGADLKSSMHKISGNWKEQDAADVKIHADFKGDSLVFAKMNYRLTDHYSSADGIAYNFKNASLNFVKIEDTVFLAGNIQLFSPERNEPSKPILIVLERIITASDKDSSLILVKDKSQIKADTIYQPAASITSAYPNPFGSYINISFKVIRNSKVSIELYTVTGQRIFVKEPENLNTGAYKIRIQPRSYPGTQTYILRLIFNGGSQNIKVIKR